MDSREVLKVKPGWINFTVVTSKRLMRGLKDEQLEELIDALIDKNATGTGGDTWR